MGERYRLPRPLSFLVEDIRGELCHGRRLRPRHGLSVRYKLELFLGLRRQHYRSATHLRSTHRLLPRSRFSRRCAVRMEQGRTGIALLRNHHGGDRHADFGELDCSFKQLDAYTRRIRDHQRPRCAGGLAEGGLQSVLSLSTGAHGCGRVPSDRAVCRGVGRPGIC